MKKTTTAAIAAITFAALTSCSSTNNAASSSSNFESKWAIADASGFSTEGSPDEAYIEFDGNGGVNGCTGANIFNGSYTIKSDGKLEFSGMILTRMAAGPYRDTEDAVVNALNDARGYKVNGEEAQILDGSGREIMKLKK